MGFFFNGYPPTGYGGNPQGNIIPGMGDLETALAQNAAMGQAMPKKKGGGFGGFLKNFAGFYGDSLTGNPIYAEMMQQQAKEQRLMEQYERKRQDELADYEAKKGIDARYQEPKDRETITVDGVVLDKETMQPVWESPYSRIVPGPDGSFYEQPRLGLGGSPQPFQPPQTAGTTGSAIREQAMEAIRRGADPAAVLKRLQQLEQGGPSQPGSGGFPR